MANVNLESSMKLGGVVGLASMLLAYLFGTLLKGWGATITFATYDINVRQQLEQGIASGATKTLTEKLLGLFGGLIPATFSDYLLVAGAGFLVVVLGKIVVDLINYKTPNMLWAVM